MKSNHDAVACQSRPGIEPLNAPLVYARRIPAPHVPGLPPAWAPIDPELQLVILDAPPPGKPPTNKGGFLTVVMVALGANHSCSFLPQLGFEKGQNCTFVPKMSRNSLFEVGGWWRVMEGTERIVIG